MTDVLCLKCKKPAPLDQVFHFGGQFVCSACRDELDPTGTNSQKVEFASDGVRGKRSPAPMGFTFLGVVLGGFVGYLLRPAAPLVGQLPFETVIRRGTNLEGLDSLFIPVAERSFNMILAGAVTGAALGLLLGFLIARGRP